MYVIHLHLGPHRSCSIPLDTSSFPSSYFMESPSSSSSSSSSSSLHASITHLKSVLSSATSTLSSLLFSSSPLSSPPLLPCPYNHRHFTPPESLYRHFLTCPSASPLPSIPPLQDDNGRENTETDFGFNDLGSESEVVFAVDGGMIDLGSGFWYNDCPGVVSAVQDPPSSFALPSFLLLECGNANGNGNSSVGKSMMSILPSEYFSLRNETASWQNIPTQYSYTALHAISVLSSVSEGDLKKWVIINSPKYGIIIDETMMDYIYLLLKLCLKAVIKEANISLEMFLETDRVLNPKSLRFQCPNLVKSFHWLSNQLSVLYGEINSKLFALNMIKEAITRSGYFNMMTNFDEKNEEGENTREIGETDKILVSQIAKAIGALYQRAFLEAKIRALRSVQPVSKPQSLMEYAYLSSKAAEERSKRPNYRPILDYDSLVSNRVHDQGNNSREKTREEMLAEERDYKRRRISYRGKKIKRSPTEVLRDIIQKHMEEIHHANTQPSFSNPNKSPNRNSDSFIDPIKPQNQNPSFPNTYESLPSHVNKSTYRKSSAFSHSFSKSSKERKDRFEDRERDRADSDKDRADKQRDRKRDRAEFDNDGTKEWDGVEIYRHKREERDRADIDRHMKKERRRDNYSNRQEKRTKERDNERSFTNRYDPTGTSEKRT